MCISPPLLGFVIFNLLKIDLGKIYLPITALFEGAFFKSGFSITPFIKVMKRATNLMIKANAKNGTQTTDHYSMMGFTKAYNKAKKSCS